MVLYAVPTLRELSISISRTRRNQSSRGTGHDVYSAWKRREIWFSSSTAREAWPRVAARRSGRLGNSNTGVSISPVSLSRW